MPAKSKAQRQAMAIAKHHPTKLYKRNVDLLKMSKRQLHEFASTKEKGLPKRKKGHNPGLQVVFSGHIPEKSAWKGGKKQR